MAEETKLSEEAQKAAEEAASPLWKKILLWVLGILGVAGSIVGIVALLKGKSPDKAAKEVIDETKRNIVKADVEAKIEAAKAVETEKEVLDKLDKIKETKDEQKALEELEKLYNK